MRKFNFQRLKGLFPRRSSAPRRRRFSSWQIEELHERLLLSALTPAQVAHAYGIDQVMFGSVKGDGTGQTIAIVDAYDAPNINSDLAAFDAAFNIQNTDGKGNAVVTKAMFQGTPAYNATWAEEITLDVEWAHAIAPGAHILLVEATSNNLANLLSGVSYAASQPGVSVVSMSWGTEFSSETSYDSYFTTPSGHTGISFIASSGDTGGVAQWPAVSPNVVSVGGTSLNISDSSGTYSSESAWSGSGGGVSLYESKPSYQSSVTQSSTMRTGPDVAWDANPGTGVEIYFNGSLTVVGGTSVGAPQWAALVAIADQGRAINGLSTLDGRTQLLPAIYSLSSSDFHDVTSGTAGSYSAGVGYDLVTGRGSPFANLVIHDLLSVAGGSTGGTSGGSTGGTTGGTTGGSTGGHHGKPKITSTPKITPLVELAAGQNLALSQLQALQPALDSGDTAHHELWQSNHLYVGHSRIA
jgi:subtilase family serine protease